jgi:PAS domain S-box-containing protein
VANVTEQRKAIEKQLAFQASALDQVADAVLALDPQRRVVYLNDAAARLYAVDRDAVLGQPADRIYRIEWPNAQGDALQQAYDEVYATGRWVGEVVHVRHDGLRIPVEVSTSLMRDAEGNPQGYLGIMRDIRDRRRAEQERRDFEAKMLAAQKLESLGVLAGGIAHDFNNLLVGVLANAGLALSDLPEGGHARQSIEQIHLAASRAAELCRQLLAYSGRSSFHVGPVDVSALVEDTLAVLLGSATRAATVVRDLPADLPAVDADATQLRQVVMNLVTNAVEALPEGAGEVRVRTAVVTCDRPRLERAFPLADLPSGRYVAVEVEDDGCGMDEATRRRIFEPFFSTKFTGRGLGLSAVLGIVRGHRGAIELCSAPGKGTTFRVLLPVSNRTVLRPGAEQMPAERSVAPEAKLVLVADDEPLVRSALRRTLERAGHAVLDAPDGQVALRLLDERRDVALAILDVTMPRLGGEATLRALRGFRPDLPVIMTSGYDENETARRFGGERISAFLQKPWRTEVLLARVREALGQHG